MSNRPTPGKHLVGASLYDGFTSCIFVDRPDGSMQTLAEVRRYKDAVLYAAAPDLLAVMRELFTAGPVELILAGNPSVVDALVTRARAAIAKAEGRE